MSSSTVKIWTLSTGCALAFLFGYRHFTSSPEGDGQPAHGVIETVETNKTSLTLLVPKTKAEQTFTWNNSTTFRKDHGPVTDTAVHPGDRVTVEYAKLGRKLVATKVVIHELHGKHHKV